MLKTIALSSNMDSNLSKYLLEQQNKNKSYK